MRHANRLLCAWIFLVAAGPAASAQVPIDKEPHHRIVFENDALRVLEVNVGAGDVTLEHIHNDDLATVTIDNSDTRTREHGQDWSPLRVREVGHINVTEYAGHPGSHEVKNVGNGHYRLIAVENRRQSNWSEAVAVSGAGTELAEKTRAYSIYNVRLGPGNTETSHKHASPVLVVLVKGRAVVRTDTTRRLERPGDWVLVPAGGTHTLMADGTDPLHVVEIEVR